MGVGCLGSLAVTIRITCAETATLDSTHHTHPVRHDETFEPSDITQPPQRVRVLARERVVDAVVGAHGGANARLHGGQVGLVVHLPRHALADVGGDGAALVLLIVAEEMLRGEGGKFQIEGRLRR